jgi:hypothetical protein
MGTMTTPNHAVSVTLAPEHWLRIRQALIAAAEDLAQANHPDHARYHHTYQLLCHVTNGWEAEQ